MNFLSNTHSFPPSDIDHLERYKNHFCPNGYSSISNRLMITLCYEVVHVQALGIQLWTTRVKMWIGNQLKLWIKSYLSFPVELFWGADNEKICDTTLHNQQRQLLRLGYWIWDTRNGLMWKYKRNWRTVFQSRKKTKLSGK